jgi:hypothetical protein
MTMLRATRELKIAQKISEMVNDLTLDLDQIGVYLATNNNITYNRLMVITESAKYEKEEKEHSQDYLF